MSCSAFFEAKIKYGFWSRVSSWKTMLDRRPYFHLGGITKTVQTVHAIVRQTHTPTTAHPPHTKFNGFAKISWVSQGPDGGGSDSRYPCPAPRLFRPRLFYVSHAFPSTSSLLWRNVETIMSSSNTLHCMTKRKTNVVHLFVQATRFIAFVTCWTILDRRCITSTNRAFSRL